MIGYKVVTEDLKSLGLRKNPNILTYPIGNWFFLEESKVEEGSGDWGGIWLCRTPSGARQLRKYMWTRHQVKTRIFKSQTAKILFSNSYRIKTNGILLLEEIKDES